MPTLLLFSLFIIFSAAEAADHFSSSNLRSGAENMIRELNLFPARDINIVADEPSPDSPRIVEKSFRFPFLIDSAPGNTSIEDFGHHAGYYRLPHTKGARMFYYFFESRNNKGSDPVVIWLTGGPGCSSSLALFYENGPFKLTNNLSLVWNDFGWDKVSNIIFVDQPTGTGFSYSSDSSDIRSTSDEAAVDFYDFLQAFFEKHPQYAKNDFFITGESYAGHYIPAFAAQIHRKNKNREGIPINLKGIAIGNGLTDPEIQYKAYPDYALDMKLIDRSQYNSLQQYVSSCEEEIQSCASNSSASCEAYLLCNRIFNEIVTINSGINYYDIRKKCEGSLCYDFSNAEEFLNSAAVRTALGVGDIEFVSCSSVVYESMTGDWVTNYEPDIPGLLQDGIRVLIYAGEFDLICNWLGNSRWVDKMEWSGRKEYVSAGWVPFTVDAVKAGLYKTFGPLTFLKVFKAGHMVPMDQPKASLQMLTKWIQNTPL